MYAKQMAASSEFTYQMIAGSKAKQGLSASSVRTITKAE